MTYTDHEIRTAFEQVQGHVLDLHARWRLFRKLYRGNENSQPVLVAVGGEMFAVLGRLLHRGVFLLFRQLTDGPRSMGHLNASFRGLLEIVAGPDYSREHGDLVARIAEIEGNGTIKLHVNKYVAHLDFDLLAGVATPPPSVEIDAVEAELAAAREFMDDFGERFLDLAPFPYDETASVMDKQADALVRTLRAGLAAQKEIS